MIALNNSARAQIKNNITPQAALFPNSDGLRPIFVVGIPLRPHPYSTSSLLHPLGPVRAPFVPPCLGVLGLMHVAHLLPRPTCTDTSHPDAHGVHPLVLALLAWPAHLRLSSPSSHGPPTLSDVHGRLAPPTRTAFALAQPLYLTHSHGRLVPDAHGVRLALSAPHSFSPSLHARPPRTPDAHGVRPRPATFLPDFIGYLPGRVTEWRGSYTSSNSPYSSSEGQDGPSQGGPPPRREGLRSGTRSQGQGSQASAGQRAGGQQRAFHPFQPPEDDDSSSVTDDTIVEDDTAWIEYIHNWKKQGEEVADNWEPDELNNSCDKQLSAYIKEHARTLPSPGIWDRWEPAWNDRKSRYPSESDRA
ncbi:hypothetical protein OG21DRAFT_1482499 [Imleria badia]|nr:hypothetical protein OG21DRAFT_1482499 [Imleria badia]